MAKKNKRRQRNTAGAGSSGGAGTTEFAAPTSGLEDVFFAWGHGQGCRQVRGHGRQAGTAREYKPVVPVLGSIKGDVYLADSKV